MRKTIMGILVIILVFLLCVNGYATEYTDPKDSRNISPEVLERIALEDTELVFKCYVLHIESVFTNYTNIDEILDKSYGVRYVQKEFSDPYLNIFITDKNGKVIERAYTKNTDIVIYQETLDELQNAEAIKAVSPDIVVQSVYYLWGENMRMGTAIYYKTNLGDYVYYRQHWLGEKLFPAEVFFAYHSRNSIDGGAKKALDISVYDYRSPNFDPHAEFPKSEPGLMTYLWVGGIAVVLVGEVAFFVIRAKRKKNEEFEISEIE